MHFTFAKIYKIWHMKSVIRHHIREISIRTIPTSIHKSESTEKSEKCYINIVTHAKMYHNKSIMHIFTGLLQKAPIKSTKWQ